MIQTMFWTFVALIAWWFLPLLSPSVRDRYRAEAEQDRKQMEAWNAEFGLAAPAAPPPPHARKHKPWWFFCLWSLAPVVAMLAIVILLAQIPPGSLVASGVIRPW